MTDKLREAAQDVIDAWKVGIIGHVNEPAITELDALKDTLAEPSATESWMREANNAKHRVELLEKRITEFKAAEQLRSSVQVGIALDRHYLNLKDCERGKKAALYEEVNKSNRRSSASGRRGPQGNCLPGRRATDMVLSNPPGNRRTGVKDRRRL